MYCIILPSDGVSLMHREEMYIGPFPFHYVLISTSPTAVTSHHIMSFKLSVSEISLRIYLIELLIYF